MTAPRYIIGIDLGTTNSAIGYVDLADTSPTTIEIKSFEIIQLITEGLTGSRLILPSFLYLLDERERAQGLLALPWDKAPKGVCGEFARMRGLSAPGRLVSSAKSWLCHGGVERRAKILPWGVEAQDLEKVSPVEASSAYLYHMRMAWNTTMDAPMEEQEVILTVPASFDEVARELTLEAAKEAGLKRVTLLEEPLAAFYAWLSHHEGEMKGVLRDQDLILVCDVGGGTTDFTLIRCLGEGSDLRLERIAVGDHLLLGGDNIDLALTAKVEKMLGKELSTMEWHGLLNQIRNIKERLLADDGPSTETVRIAGRGRGLVAGTLTAELKRDELIDEILQGFFPVIDFSKPVEASEGSALREMGLPYEQDPAITRHLLRFIKVHGEGRLPTKILFNGGTLKPAPVRNRLLEVLSNWAGSQVTPLTSMSLDLAISHGAAYYGLTRHGLGLRIGGGIPRAYYIGVEGRETEGERAVCIVERGTEEGQEIEVPGRYNAITNRPVSFKLYSSTTRKGDRLGDLVDCQGLHSLPPLVTVLKYGKKGSHQEIPVSLRAVVTAIGTLELFCTSLKGPHRWRLQFDLRGAQKHQPKGGEEGVRIRQKGGHGPTAQLSPEDRRAIEEARPVIEDFFLGKVKGRPLLTSIQEIVGMEKGLWTLPLLRAISDILLKLEPKRSTAPQKEAQWFNITGYTLRPGIGDELDPWRIKGVWPIWFKGLFFPSDKGTRLQWWIFWRRIAPGLGPGQQEQIFGQVAKAIMPKTKGRKKGPKPTKIGGEERREILLLLGALEKVSPDKKVGLGRFVLEELGKKGVVRSSEPHTKALVWLIGKLGAREPFYGPIDRVVPPQEVSQWLKKLRTMEIEPSTPFFYSLMGMTRFTGDRARDLTKKDREEIRLWLEALGANDEFTRPLMELVPYDRAEQTYSYGEELPQGIILAKDG